MPSCVFRYCKNSSKNVSKSSGITFHRFVRPDHKKREAWIAIVQHDRSEYTWLPTDFSCICSAHFKADDFYTTTAGRRFLRDSAIPKNIFSEQSSEDGHASPTSLDNVEISDSESLLDSPKEIMLKRDLKKALASKKLMSKRIKKLQRQNKNLNRKAEKLTNIVKRLRNEFGINKKIKRTTGSLSQSVTTDPSLVEIIIP